MRTRQMKLALRQRRGLWICLWLRGGRWWRFCASRIARFGADAATERSLDRLAKGAVAIVTGQQVGLFSGPAYSFYKALTAIRWAEKFDRARD